MTQAQDVEFIGMIQPRAQSEIHPPSGPAIDPGYLRASAQAHDEGGFDRILVGWFSNGPDGLQIAAHAGAHTKRVGFLVAHRPGFQSPTTAARAFATLDQLTGGRAAIHVISGGDDADQARDGDWLGKEDRYARTDEYVSVLKAVWTAGAPVDHEGAFYRIKGASPEVRTVQRPRIPIYFGGASEAALRVAGKHADVYALWGETRAQVREITARVRAEAARHGREVRFSLSFRPILAETEGAAWAKAERILGRIREVRGQAALGAAGKGPRPRTRGRSACWRPRRGATARRGGSTPPSRGKRARGATPRPWSEHRSRWPRPSLSTTRSAFPPS